MMKKLFFSLFCMLVVVFYSYGSHVSGGYISYTCLGNNQYEVTLNLFRDCSGISLPSSQTIDLSSTCGQVLTASLSLVNVGGTEISQVCSPQLPQTTCSGGTLPGNELYTYQGIVTLTPACNTWTMSWDVCCRNTTVSVPTSSSDGVYLEATLNSTTAVCNSSASFLTPYPIYYACANQQTVINYTVAEPDNDNLVYTLISASESSTLNLVYGGGYSGASPLPGIVVDQATGEIIFTPTTLGNFILVLQVEEFDAAGNLLGTNYIDAQVVVQSCPANSNPTPPITGIQNFTGNGATQTGPNSIDLCVNDDFCFDVSFSDADGNSMTLESNVNAILPGATVTYNTATPGIAIATVCWTAVPNFQGSTIVISANDNQCPTPSIATFSVDVNINLGTYAGDDDTICGNMSKNFFAQGGTIFNWTAISGDPIVVGTNFTANPSQTPTATPSQTTTYEVVSNLAGTCSNRDTVTVVVQQNLNDIFITSISATPTIVCLGDTSRLEVVTIPPVSSCDYSIDMFDSFGDGWNGASVEVLENGVSIGLLGSGFGSGSAFSENFTVNDGTTLNFVFISGAWNSEISFNIIDAQGNTIYSDDYTTSTPPATGTNIFTTTAACAIPDPYTYLWSPAADLDTPSSAAPLATLSSSSDFIVSVFDVNMCWVSDTVSVTATNPFGIISSGITSSCAGANTGGATIVINGGTGPFNYFWPNGETSNTATGLTPGVQIVTVSDIGAGCSKDTAITIPASALGVSITSFTTTNVSCFNFNDGTATVLLSGGSGGLIYDWGNVISGNPTTSATNIPAGTHTLVVTDNVGCFDDTTFIITTPPIISVTASSTTTSHCNQPDGTATVSAVTGGSSTSYLYQWSNGLAGASISNLLTGQYCVTVSDVITTACNTVHCVTVSTTPFPTATTTSIAASCNAYFDGTSSVIVTPALGGSSVFSYQWDMAANFQNTVTATGLGVGIYSVTATDASGCYAITTTNITEPSRISVTLSASQTEICEGQCVNLSVNAAGGIGSPYSYVIASNTGSTVGQQDTLCLLSSGGIIASATDGNGCQYFSDNLNINVKPPLQPLSMADTSVCDGNSTTIWASVTGGNGGPYIYNWSHGLGIGSIQNVTPTTYPNTEKYIVTISDGCSVDVTDTVKVLFYTTPNPSIFSDNYSGCQPFTVNISPVSSSLQNVATCMWTLQDGTVFNDNSCGGFTHTFNVVDLHDVTLSVISNDGCPGKHTYTNMIQVYQLPVANFTSSPNPTILNPIVKYSDKSIGDIAVWDWNFYYLNGGKGMGVDSIQNPSFIYPVDTGVYPVYLHVVTSNGCEDDTLKNVFINGAYLFYVPNAFTPNGDGKNDVFKPTGTGFSTLENGEYRMEIYDRWGAILFTTNLFDEGWNGKDNNGTGDYVPADTYIYKITTTKSTERWENGSFDTTPFEYIGTVISVR